jgi:cytochrome c oxidase cbb3-type subunit 1
MQPEAEHRYLLKFVVVSAVSFFIGSVHGVLQVMRPIRAWLDSVGSPYGGPGHMIDPLAHAHINLIGGVTVLIMAMSYYLVSKILGLPFATRRLTNLSFWLTTLGIYSFYSVLLFFGVWEGNMLLAHSGDIDEIHHRYAIPAIATASSIMGIGLWLYLYNILSAVSGSRRP